jgi:hypothetical protein
LKAAIETVHDIRARRPLQRPNLPAKARKREKMGPIVSKRRPIP